MKISIAMAVYNGEKHLAAQLASFSAQTRLPDELVACDDGSTDGSLAVLEAFAREAPFPVRIHRNPGNLGYGPNFAQALGLCSGDLIFPSDQDDVWFQDRLSVVQGMAERDPETRIWMNDAELTDADLNPSGFTKLGQLRSAGIKPTSFVQGCCCAIRREFLAWALPIPDVFKAHDGWLVELADCLGTRRILRQPLQFYRIHGKNTSGFFVNRPVRVGILAKVRSRLASLSRETMRAEIALEGRKVEALAERVLALRSRPGFGLAGRAQTALSTLQERRAALGRRGDLIGMPRLPRMLPAVRMLARGEYARHFNSYDSFVKDMLA